MSFGMLTRVNIKAIRGGVPAIVEGEIVGHQPPNTSGGEAYDVLLPAGCVAPHSYRGSEIGGDPRICIKVPPSDLKFAGAAVREITFSEMVYRLRNAVRSYGAAA